MTSSPVLQPLATLDALDAAIARSSSHPIVIFKHSPTCGTSAQARESIEELLASRPPDADWYVVSVLANRDVSNAIAERFSVRHESPQALVIEDGALVWQGSHFRVTGPALASALAHLPAPR